MEFRVNSFNLFGLRNGLLSSGARTAPVPKRVSALGALTKLTNSPFDKKNQHTAYRYHLYLKARRKFESDLRACSSVSAITTTTTSRLEPLSLAGGLDSANDKLVLAAIHIALINDRKERERSAPL